MHRVIGVFPYLYGFEALVGRGKSVLLHGVELVGEDRMDGLMVINSMG